MKTGLLSIFLHLLPHKLLLLKRVVIRASERSTVTNSVIIPVPVRNSKTSDTATTSKNVTPSPAVNSSAKKNTNVKCVRGGSGKKPCVKKVSVHKKKSKTEQNPKPVESTRK
jgi:hypothetical protein